MQSKTKQSVCCATSPSRSYNVHEDADLAQDIVRLCLDLPFKSSVLKHKLQDDMQHLTELIEEESKDEVRFKVGAEPFEITRAGARRGGSFIPAAKVDSLRWGTVSPGTAMRLCTTSR